MKRFGYDSPKEKFRDAQACVFPFTLERNGETIFLATGFLINQYGGFVTATHVFDDKGMEITAEVRAACWDRNGNPVYCKIKSIRKHHSADVCVGLLVTEDGGKIETRNLRLGVSTQKRRIGDRVMTFAYPKSHVIDEGDIQKGKFVVNKPNGRITNFQFRDDILAKGNVIYSNMKVLSGASGGPTLHKGWVIGVNSTGQSVEKGKSDHSTTVPISYALEIPVYKGMNIMQIHRTGYGSIKFQQNKYRSIKPVKHRPKKSKR